MFYIKKYSIKNSKKDFRVFDANYITKGSRIKKLVIDKDGNKAFFKYEGMNYDVSESCSEKICYEIAKVLGYNCARIELAKDENGILGVLNYWFVDLDNREHIDAISYLKFNNENRSEFYTISNIKETLDRLDLSLFRDFIKIMIFDALVGEQDRHEENWGIEIIQGKYQISPLYDNGCSLLREFKNDVFASKFYSGEKNFESYINKSKTLIYKDDGRGKYKHFELIEYLNLNYYNDVQCELNNLKKLTDQRIEVIVNMIPCDVGLSNKSDRVTTNQL